MSFYNLEDLSTSKEMTGITIKKIEISAILAENQL